MRVLVPVVIASLLGVALSTALPSAASDETRGGQAGVLSQDERTSAATTVSVILELDAEPASVVYSSARVLGARAAASASARQSDRVRALQSSVGVRAAALGAREIFRTSAVYAGIAVRVRSDRLDALASLPGVASVRPLVSVEPQNWASVPLMGAPQAWERADLTGAGISIGIIDTGVDYTHADFGGPGTREAYTTARAAKDLGESPVYPDPAKVAGGYDFAGNAYNSRDPAAATPQPDDNPLDCGGHGTHVAGTAAGYGVTRSGATYRGPWDADVPFADLGIGPGVAPEATLYALKIFGCRGSSDLVIEALDWAMDPNGDGDLSDHLDVVNMSLGSPFGTLEDPTTIATQNAVLAGMSVVVAAGNNSTPYLISGAPSVAPAAISVAASGSDGLVIDAMRLRVGDQARDDTVVGRQSGYFGLTRSPDVTAPLARIGDWGASPGSGNNSDGCSPLSAEQAQAVAGRILVVVRPDPARCRETQVVANTNATDAVGLILATSRRTPGEYPPARDLPAFSVLAPTTERLRGAFDAGQQMEATLGSFGVNAGRFVYPASLSRASQVAAFSSMGGPLKGTVKPDVAAPGLSIFSAESGSGSGGWSTLGTSMAAPHVAGQAALVLQAHPGWTALDVKSAIAATANHDLYLKPGGEGPRIDPMRVGAGRVDVPLSLAADAVISIPGHPGSTSVSFGIIDTRVGLVRSQTVRVTDKRTSGAARTFTVRLDAINTLPGASMAVSPATLKLSPGKSGDVTVTLRVTPKDLIHRADPALELVPEGTTWMREFLAPATAMLHVESPRAPTLRVPVAAAPRPVSELSSSGPVTLSGEGDRQTGTLTLRGEGVHTSAAVPDERIKSRVSAVQLLGSSPRLPSRGGTWYPGVDLRYVGASSDALLSRGNPLSVDDSAMGYFAVAAWDVWQTPVGAAAFRVYLDTNRDGSADALLTSEDLSRNNSTQIMVAALTSLRPGDDGTARINRSLLNGVDGRRDTAKIHGNVVVLPVRLAALAQPGAFSKKVSAAPSISAADARVNFWVTSTVPSPGGTLEVDAIGSAQAPMTIDLLSPAVTAFVARERPMASAAMPGTRLDVTVLREALGAKPSLLVLHHLNAAAHRAEIVPIG